MTQPAFQPAELSSALPEQIPDADQAPDDFVAHLFDEDGDQDVSQDAEYEEAETDEADLDDDPAVHEVA